MPVGEARIVVPQRRANFTSPSGGTAMHRKRGSTRGPATPAACNPRRLGRGARALVSGLLCVAGIALHAAPAAEAQTTVAVAEADEGVLYGWYMRKVAD